jgi:hypothetical protein
VGLTGVNSAGLGYVGGLAGKNSKTIGNVFVTGSVTGINDYVGGLTGYNNSTISNAYTIGSVIGSSNDVGGLAGYNDSTISNVYSGSNVTGDNNHTGGLTGYNFGLISNASATGSVTGNVYVGGLAGYNGGSLSYTFAAGAVSGTTTGGLVGRNYIGTVNNSFWDADSTGQSSGYGLSSGSTWTDNAPLYSSTGSTAFQSASYIGFNISASGGSSAIWRIYEGKSYPLLRGFLAPLTVTAIDLTKGFDNIPYSGGNGVSYSTAPNANLLGTVSFSGTSQGATAIGGPYGIIPSGLYSNQQGYDISYVNGALNIVPATATVTVTIAGSGSVNSHNQGTTNYGCNKVNGGICDPMTFAYNDQVTLSPTGSNSTFSAWSGAFNGSDNPLVFTITGNKAVTATFTPDPSRARVVSDPATRYYTIGAALAAPTQDGEIRALETPDFVETITMTNSRNLKLRGGFTALDFSDVGRTGYSIIDGWLKIKAGKLTVERVKVRP